MEKDKIFTILNDWNSWNKPLPATFSRPLYEQDIARKASSGEVLVIKGVRRSGKSTLLTNETLPSNVNCGCLRWRQKSCISQLSH